MTPDFAAAACRAPRFGTNLVTEEEESDERVLRVGVPVTETAKWWICPNYPPCGHGAILHDVEDRDDKSPICCMEDCRCGQSTTRMGDDQRHPEQPVGQPSGD